MNPLLIRAYCETDDGYEMVYFDKGEFDNGIWFESPKHIDSYKAIMFFTGLTDKNEIKIFSGDICKMPSGKIIVVEFYQGGFGWKSNIYDDFISFSGHNIFDKLMKNIEVIGNIHENPDLLISGNLM